MDYNELVERALKAGFHKAAVLDVACLDFKEEVRDMCRSNVCGAYGKNWACPPACGSVTECAEKTKGYKGGILVEFIGQLEDSFDYEGMQAASAGFKEIFTTFTDELRETSGQKILAMGAGGCTRCEKCGCPDIPCRFPDKLFSSMEACGLLVSDICKACGLPYINGVNTVTYVGTILM